MTTTATSTSAADLALGTGTVILDTEVGERAPWSGIIAAGDVLRSSICTATRPWTPSSTASTSPERLDRRRAIAPRPPSRHRGNLFLTTGSVLRDQESRPLVTIVADEVGNHDTVGGACSQSRTRFATGTTPNTSTPVENFLIEGSRHGLGKADMVGNVNFFMNVPVDPDGTLGIVDGLSAPGKRLALRAEVDTLVLISNCPQINNPATASTPPPCASS